MYVRPYRVCIRYDMCIYKTQLCSSRAGYILFFQCIRLYLYKVDKALRRMDDKLLFRDTFHLGCFSTITGFLHSSFEQYFARTCGTPKSDDKNNVNIFKVNNKKHLSSVIGVVLVFLLLSLNIPHTFS